MGEIDQKKPFESVQDALSLFGDNKSNHVKSRSSSSDDMQKEEMDVLRRELAKLKLKLEEKDSAYKQAILKLDHTQSVVEDLSSILTGNELEKEISIYEGRQDKVLIKTLQLRFNQMQDQLHVTEKEVTKLRDENLATIKRAELSETILNMERGETEELHNKVAELNETIEHFKMMENEANKEKTQMLIQKNALEAKLEMVNDLDNQLQEKSEFIHKLQMELHLANEIALKKVVSNDSCQFDQFKEEMELQEKKNLDQAGYISLLETELKQLKQLKIKAKETELENEDIKEIEQLKKDLENARTKMGELRNRGEQAISRAEAAEKAKATLEEQIQRRRDQRKRRKAALAALQEASTSRQIHSSDHENGCNIYQPLGEVLNMRF
ncbi:hypothetical protein LIER_01248 [Lithospermum erythrorhizon]|uniref:Uncharacterized protein n=1 Tax=Lithospermum erythrorhizon TaxID=34254 RepID=A0AAV3NQ19_LITER